MSEKTLSCSAPYSRDLAMDRVFRLLDGEDRMYVLKQEDGTDTRYVFLDVIEYEERIYAAMFVEGEDPNKFSVFSVNGSTQLDVRDTQDMDFAFVSEDSLKDALFDIFKVRNQGVYELTQ